MTYSIKNTIFILLLILISILVDLIIIPYTLIKKHKYKLKHQTL